MRYLVYSDLQAGISSTRSFVQPGLSLQLYRVEKFYQVLLQLYTDLRVDGLIDLGDTFDDRSSLPIPAIDTVLAGLYKFPNSPFHLRITGNHDQFLRDGNVHNGKLFERFFHVAFGYEEMVIDDTAVLLCPFPRSFDELTDQIQNGKLRHAGKQIILLGHFPVLGSKVADGTLEKGINPRVLNGLALALLGDIHKPQSITPWAHYVGSPFQQNFGEAGEVKRVGLLDTDTCFVQWIPLTGFPCYRTLNLGHFIDEADPLSEDRIEVILATPEEAEKFYAHPLSGRAIPTYAYTSADPGNEKPVEIAHVETLEASMRNYIKQVPPTSRGITASTEDLIQLGIDVLRIA